MLVSGSVHTYIYIYIIYVYIFFILFNAVPAGQGNVSFEMRSPLENADLFLVQL